MTEELNINDLSKNDLQKITDQFERDQILIKYIQCGTLCPCLHDIEDYEKSILFCMIGSKFYKVNNKSLNSKKFHNKLRRLHLQNKECEPVKIKISVLKLTEIDMTEELDKIVHEDFTTTYYALKYTDKEEKIENNDKVQLFCVRYNIMTVYDKHLRNPTTNNDN